MRRVAVLSVLAAMVCSAAVAEADLPPRVVCLTLETSGGEGTTCLVDEQGPPPLEFTDTPLHVKVTYLDGISEDQATVNVYVGTTHYAGIGISRVQTGPGHEHWTVYAHNLACDECWFPLICYLFQNPMSPGSWRVRILGVGTDC